MSNKDMKAALEAANLRIKELEEKLALSEKAVATMQSAPAGQVSKSRQQAEKALELLKAGTVTLEQLKSINEKYPSDPIYFVRTILKVSVITHKAKGQATTYSLPTAASTEEKKEEQPAPAPEPTKA